MLLLALPMRNDFILELRDDACGLGYRQLNGKEPDKSGSNTCHQSGPAPLPPSPAVTLAKSGYLVPAEHK